MSKVSSAVAGAIIGAVVVAMATFLGSAAIHWIKYRTWEEFWGIIVAIRSAPIGAVLGAFLGYWIKK